MHTKRSTCRGCGASDLYKFLELGQTPLANSFLRDSSEFADEVSFPLDVYSCPICSLVQLVDVIDPGVLFRDYIYVSGTSETITTHFLEYTRSVIDRLAVTSDDLVVDIASNDGTLLKCFQAEGVNVVGVEPAVNIAAVAIQSGVETLNAFFDMKVAVEICETRGRAKVVTANNVVAHVDEPREFLTACRHLLANDGRLIIEVPYLDHLIEGLEYDTIYHEHLSYFSVTSLARLFFESGLAIEKIDQVAIHGGSLRVWGRSRSELEDHDESVKRLIESESANGLTSSARLDEFSNRVSTHREQLNDALNSLTGRATVAGYAAPAKGNTLLNYCQIDASRLPFIFDKNPWKVGRFTPGMHIPIRDTGEIEEVRPDYLLILAWNFAEEIIRQQDAFRRHGGQFIIPIPEVKIV